MFRAAVAVFTALLAGNVPGVGGTQVAVLAHHVGQTLALAAGELTVAVSQRGAGVRGSALVVADAL